MLPLPALANGALSPGAYIFQTAASLLAMYFAFRLFIAGPLESSAPAVFSPLLSTLGNMAGDNHLFRRLLENSCLDLLVMCLESGMDAAQALKLLQGSVPGRKLKSRLAFAASAVRNSGSDLSSALEQNGILRNPEVLLFFRTCEASGTLHSDMRTYVSRTREQLAATLDYWIRRIAVLVFVGVVAYAAMRIVPLFTGMLPA